MSPQKPTKARATAEHARSQSSLPRMRTRESWVDSKKAAFGAGLARETAPLSESPASGLRVAALPRRRRGEQVLASAGPRTPGLATPRRDERNG